MGCFIFGSGGGKNNGGGGPDFSLVNMEPQFALAGKRFYNRNQDLRTGTIPNWNGEQVALLPGDEWPTPDITPSLEASYIPSGYYIGQDIKIAGMPVGDIRTVEYTDAHSIVITFGAGYISGSREIALPNLPFYSFGAADHTYTGNTARYYIAPMDPDFSGDLDKTFLACLFAHGSVSSGEIAAISIGKQEDSSWAAMAYVTGNYPKTPSVDVWYAPPGEGETGPGGLVIEILSKQGEAQYCAFSTSKYYEGFFLYTD